MFIGGGKRCTSRSLVFPACCCSTSPVEKSTGCKQLISLAVVELVYCCKRPNVQNFLHLSHRFLHTSTSSFAAQQPLHCSPASHKSNVPCCKVGGIISSSKVTHVQRLQSSYPDNDSHPPGTWKRPNCFLSDSAPNRPPNLHCPLVIFHVCSCFVFVHLFSELASRPEREWGWTSLWPKR